MGYPLDTRLSQRARMMPRQWGSVEARQSSEEKKTGEKVPGDSKGRKRGKVSGGKRKRGIRVKKEGGIEKGGRTGSRWSRSVSGGIAKEKMGAGRG